MTASPPKGQARVLSLPSSPGPDPALVREVVQAIREGLVLILPTDTVYGIAAGALNGEALRRIRRLKGRDPSKPISLLAGSAEEARRLIVWNEPAERLAGRFWPGALTLVGRPTPDGAALADPSLDSAAGRETSPLKTLAVRVPNHAFLLEVIRSAGVPLAATSANLSGHPPASREEEVRSFRDQVDCIVQGGDLPGRESAVVDVSGPVPRILREGALGASVLQQAMP